MSDFATQREMMVDSQIRPSDVTKYPVIEAMLEIPREIFVPDEKRPVAYQDENIEIAPGRVLLAPRSFAKLLNELDVEPGDMVLDLGSGLGYSAAVLAWLSEAVVGVEEIEGLAEEGQNLLSSIGIDNAAVLAGPLAEGAPKHGPYDVIMIEGGVECIPDAITAQLREGGRIGAIFMQDDLGQARVGVKVEGEITWRHAFNAGAPVLEGFEKKPEFVL